ncbi:MAG: response regulator [Leptospira sp.]|nr:response regulator [Leptospira sp.]
MKSVLCVDDDPIALGIQSILLKQSKFCDQTITKTNGEEALQYYESLLPLIANESIYPSIVFLDLNMPVVDGWGFLETFHLKYILHFPDTKVYILTSSVDPEDKERASKYSFVKDFISKPITKFILEKIKNIGF